MRRLQIVGSLAVLLLGLASLPRLGLVPVRAAPLAAEAGTWTAGPRLGTARTEVAAAVLDGVLYVVGQYPGSSGPPGANEAYDPRVGQWASRAPLPAELDHACAAAFDGRLYVVGGYLRAGRGVNTLFAYDPAA